MNRDSKLHDPATTAQNPFSRGVAAGPLTPVCLCLIGGILSSSATDNLGLLVWKLRFPLIVVGATYLLYPAMRCWAPKLPRLPDRVATIAIWILVWLVGMGWQFAWNHRYPPSHLARSIGTQPVPMGIRGTARSCPATKSARSATSELRSELQIRVTAIRRDGTWQPATGRARLFVPGVLTSIDYGDEFECFGLVSRPQPPTNPGEFDYAQHEANQRLWLMIRLRDTGCLQRVRRSHSGQVIGFLNRLPDSCRLNLARHLQSRNAAVAKALLLGQREELNAEQKTAFFETGVIHLLAISGLHVGILASGVSLMRRCGWVSRRGDWLLQLAFVIMYAVLVGAKPPVVRAAILIATHATANYLGRSASIWNGISLAAILLLLSNPNLLFHVGVQLSFLAVSVLASLPSQFEHSHKTHKEDALQRLLVVNRPFYVRWFQWLLKNLLATCYVSSLVWLIVAPLVWYRMGVVAPIGLVLNPLLAIPVVIALYTAALIMVLGNSWLPIASLLQPICDGALNFILWIVHIGQSIPYGCLYLRAPPLWWLFLFYAAASGIFILPRQYRRRLEWGLAVLFVSGLLYFPHQLPSTATHQAGLQVTFLNVGHGNAVVVRSPAGKTMVYDAGSLSTNQAATARIISRYLHSEGVRRIDALVLSHADIDHYGAAETLLQELPVDVIISSTRFARHPETESLRHLAENLAIPWQAVSTTTPRDELPIASEILHPPPDTDFANDNANSVVLRLHLANQALILPGDIEKDGLNSLLTAKVKTSTCDVLLAPHHGSRHSQPQQVLRWCQPQCVVVSRGRSTTPTPYHQLGVDVLETNKGAVRVHFSRNQIRVFQWASGKFQLRFRYNRAGGTADERAEDQ